MPFIDSHAHLNSPEFKENWKNIVTEAKNSGISAIINVAGDLSDSEWGIKQAEQEPVVYATVGVHPEDLRGRVPDPERLVNNLRRLIDSSSKVVATGEIGLDYTLDPGQAPKQSQLDLIIPQLQLAHQLALPVILHVRDQPGSTNCFSDMVDLLKQFTTSDLSVQHQAPSLQQLPASSQPGTSLASNKISSNLYPNRGAMTSLQHDDQSNSRSSNLALSQSRSLRGVFHCWTGTPEQVKQALQLDFFISFSGILTYKSAGHILDAAAFVPDNRLLIETDSPFLTPEPARSKEHPTVNEPKYVILTAEKLANIRHTTVENIAKITTQNAKALFGLS